MPHTSHRKKKQPPRTKRTEVTDEDGWTRVTTNDSLRRRPQPLAAQSIVERRYDHLLSPSYTIAEATKDTTVVRLEERFRSTERKWLASQSCHDLEQCLTCSVDAEVVKTVDQCFVFGTGSFSGHVQGWIERFEVSLYQLAAFMSVVSTIGEYLCGGVYEIAVAEVGTERISGNRPSLYAQEPVYNQLDQDLLSHLGITTLASPAGFKAVSPQAFVYTPNAELEVTLRVLAANPSIAMVSGKLDSYWRNDRGEACTNRILVHVPDSKIVDPDADDAGDYSVDCNDSRSRMKTLHELDEKERLAYDGTKRLREEIEEGLVVEEGFKRDKDVRRLASLDAKDEPFFDVHIYFRRIADRESQAKENTMQ